MINDFNTNDHDSTIDITLNKLTQNEPAVFHLL